MLLYLALKITRSVMATNVLPLLFFFGLCKIMAYSTHTDGSKRISDGTLVELTLMITESRTEEKDVMVKVVVNLITAVALK